MLVWVFCSGGVCRWLARARICVVGDLGTASLCYYSIWEDLDRDSILSAKRTATRTYVDDQNDGQRTDFRFHGSHLLTLPKSSAKFLNYQALQRRQSLGYLP